MEVRQLLVDGICPFCNEPFRSIVHGGMKTEELATASTPVRPPTPTTVPATFEELFEVERGRLFGALCLVTGNRHEAEELAQDAFLRVWERWDRVGAMEDPTGYLYRTAMNGFRSRYRRSLLALRKQLTSRETHDGLAAVEEREAVVRSLGRLTHKRRAAVVLLDLLEFSSEEAGTMLGMNPGAVRTQASRGRAELRRMAGDRDE